MKVKDDVALNCLARLDCILHLVVNCSIGLKDIRLGAKLNFGVAWKHRLLLKGL